MTTAAGAVAAYGGVIALVLPRAGAHLVELAPGAGAGLALVLAALVTDGRGLGVALWLGGATYVAFLVAAHSGIDGAAPLVAVLLLLCGELATWSLDERSRMRTDAGLIWRRGGAVGLLALGGLMLATLSVVLGAAPSAHGLVFTFLGAIAAIAAAGTGILLARR
ncbi:MAG: hypothetical protein QOG85_2185 [Gaiellaceae bacterium]|nr:hypothetical protein [Gaiellaceae bacterium]